ncbi:hypothetical protein P3T18_000649 [Paraburkholderia sp. GAS199]|uniref:cupin-like domain-containing protein n=1 Tax=Paraburkholderia sp. GAS199 TaxID=3035126 RepID=UPI003D19FB18
MLKHVARDALDACMDVRLDARLAEHYVAPPQTVCVDLRVSDCPDASRRFVLGSQIESVRLAHVSGLATPSARITLNLALLSAMLDDPTNFDPRSAKSLSLGGVQIEGAERLAAYWLQLLKRPSPAARVALDRAARRAPSTLSSVPIYHANTRDDSALHDTIAATLDASVPLLVRELIQWPEIAWTLAEWRERERTTVLRHEPTSGAPQTVGDFIDGFDSPTQRGAYTKGCLLPPAWEARFALPSLPAGLFGAAQLWFGNASAALVTRLHCDLASSFLAQIHGRKRVRLYAPSQEHAVYALDSFNTYRPCRVDVGSPDLARFPRFADARGVDIVLAPGDLLVIPTGWFHCVWALDPVFSISRFADDVSACAMLRRREPTLHSLAT